MKTSLTIGTRQSLLALWQSNHIAALLRKQYPDCEVILKKIVTRGDKILDVPLAQIGGKGLFTKEIEEELINVRYHEKLRCNIALYGARYSAR